MQTSSSEDSRRNFPRLTRDRGSSADEGVPPKGSGWRGRGEPMQVGVGHTAREYCDGHLEDASIS